MQQILVLQVILAISALLVGLVIKVILEKLGHRVILVRQVQQVFQDWQ